MYGCQFFCFAGTEKEKRMNKRKNIADGFSCISRMYGMIFMKIYNFVYSLLSLLNDYRYHI